jgi:hypothetical protein
MNSKRDAQTRLREGGDASDIHIEFAIYMRTIIQLEHDNTNTITTIHVDQLPNSMLCCT